MKCIFCSEEATYNANLVQPRVNDGDEITIHLPRPLCLTHMGATLDQLQIPDVWDEICQKSKPDMDPDVSKVKIKLQKLVTLPYEIATSFSQMRQSITSLQEVSGPARKRMAKMCSNHARKCAQAFRNHPALPQQARAEVAVKLDKFADAFVEFEPNVSDDSFFRANLGKLGEIYNEVQTAIAGVLDRLSMS